MELYYHDVDKDVLIIKADGGINSDNVEQFVGELNGLIDSGIRKLIVDCSRLNYISSDGIGTIFRLHKRLAEKGGDVKLAALNHVVARILELTRLNAVFHIHPTVDEARRAFRDDA